MAEIWYEVFQDLEGVPDIVPSINLLLIN